MLGVATDCVDQIELALTEACTNVLKHAVETHGEYEVRIEVDHDRCSIRVTDSKGETFDHALYGKENPHLSAESGRGIFIMRAMVDQLEFYAEPNSGAAVHLVKQLKLDDGSILGKLAAKTA
jgi:anti-sigma regulatory factor (Ser/Thr protein kinase)